MREIKFSADELVSALLEISGEKPVCLLDSCAVNYLDSHLLIAGVNPIETFEITNENPADTLRFLDEKLSLPDVACFFTVSYDFGLKLERIKPRPKEFSTFSEPDVFLACFDCLIVHDYNENQSFLAGSEDKFNEVEKLLAEFSTKRKKHAVSGSSKITSNFTRQSYIAAIEKIKEAIKRGDTYQTNLTQQLHAQLPENLTAQEIFRRLRTNHPAPFAAFIKREADAVVSISPERFFRVENDKSKTADKEIEFANVNSRIISASPIKGTRPRGKTTDEDLLLRNQLLESEKDRAENVMIVDLLRNDIGRICKFGSVAVEKLCELETHPTLFHLVSTVSGKLRENLRFSDIIRAVFPCGSITGAPKIRTMQIIDEIETAPRGLSMGAIGFSVQGSKLKFQASASDTYHYLDLNVAIRTMVVRGQEAVFNVGGGIVIDSDPQTEYEETLTKARALLKALNAEDWTENQIN